MFEKIISFFKGLKKTEENKGKSKDTAKERLHLVLMQDRANVSADFLELMKQEIIDVIKKYIDVDENAIDVRLTNKTNEDGTNGAPALYANIPITNIKNDLGTVIKEPKQEESNVIDENKKEEKIETKEETPEIGEEKPKVEETKLEVIKKEESQENKEEEVLEEIKEAEEIKDKIETESKEE